MDRMLATDEQIDQARTEAGIQALFHDAASAHAAGLTEAQYERYRKATDEARRTRQRGSA